MSAKDLIYLKFISSETLFTLKVVFIGIALLFLFFIFYFIRKTNWLRWRHTQDMTEFFTFKPYRIKKYEKIWAKITGRLELASESEYKLAIIEVDGLLNEILERMGYQGATIEEKLKKIPADVLPNTQDIWEVHKIRNNIVHDPDYKITLDQTKKAIAIYGKALQDLETF